MRLKIIILCLLCISSNLYAQVYPQGGFETYTGPNSLFLFTPWAGLRFGLSNNASLIFKYYNHNIRYDYLNDQDEETKRVAHLSNCTMVLYVQKGGHDFYSALSFFWGTDSYEALAFDAGTELRISDWLSVEAAIYLLDEDSILWYPDEEVRRIFLYSVNGGVKFKLNKWISINPKIYLDKNSEDVKASMYSIGLVFTPKDSIYINLIYFKYSESAIYRFSGEYISVGLNFYY